MREIEDRLRDAFDADAQTVRPEAVRPLARPEQARPRQAQRGRLVVPLLAGAAVALVAVVLAVALPILRPGEASKHRPPAGAAARPPSGFLTVTTNEAVYHGNFVIRYGTETLQLRSVHGGKVVATLLASLGAINAVMAPDGSVIAVEDFGCRVRVLRISPRSHHIRLIRTLPESVNDLALSPDGRQLAYVTYPATYRQQCLPARQPTSPVPLQPSPGFYVAPSLLAVMDLASGSVVSKPTWDIIDLSWSPDGTSFSVIYNGSIEVLPAASSDVATTARLFPPKGCNYIAATWTTSGLLAIRSCGEQPQHAPPTLIQMSATGRRTWRLPSCVEDAQLIVDPTFSHVLVQSDVGFGYGPRCGIHHLARSARIAEVLPAGLATIAIFPQDAAGYEPWVTGW